MKDKILSILTLLIFEPIIYFIIGLGVIWIVAMFLNCVSPVVQSFMRSNGCLKIGLIFAALDFIYGLIRTPKAVNGKNYSIDLTKVKFYDKI